MAVAQRVPLAAGPRRHGVPRAGGTAPDLARRDATGLLALQRLAGNRAVGQLVRLPLDGIDHPYAKAVTAGNLRFRMPEYFDLQHLVAGTAVTIPLAVIKDRVAKLLGRMAHEGRLRSADPVPTIIAKIFPALGGVDQAEFDAALDVNDRTVVYKSVLDANTKVKTADRAPLRAQIANARALIAQVRADNAGLQAVFGGKRDEAKENYRKARIALSGLSSHMGSRITTDYNLDDPEVGLGGWAQFNTRHVHLLSDIVEVVDPDATKTTLIHESSHLADSSVDDLGYYGSHGFEAMSEDDKLHNAAHYEELPRRLMGTSQYPALVFAPGVMAAGGHMTRTDRILRRASEHLRRAWDAAVDVHSLLRDVRKAAIAAPADWAPFNTHRALIIKISRLMDLTVHLQDPAQERVTALDVTITESIARAMDLIGNEVDNVAVPGRPTTELNAKRKVIARAVVAYGHLLGSATRDRKLINWLKAQYHQVPGL